jgi:lipid-A-disaccharide synthase-like uncharacterized protein
LGQLISYYIYIWNLIEIGVWGKINVVFKAILFLTPICAIGFVLKNGNYFVSNFLNNSKIPLWLIILGSAGQIIFTLRFVYQWICSIRRNESLLPVGSGIIASYGVIRVDPILILGQSVGFIAYTRNIAIYRKELKTLSHDEPIYE